MTCVASAPILALIRVPRDYDYYTGGIYEHVWGESGDPTCDHAVCIVGYNTTGETHYWIVKNSLKEDFELIKMGECGIEYLGCYWMSDSILPSIPVAPSNLNANAVSPSTIRVTWIDHSDNESGFEIQQKKGSGSWQHNCTVGANVTSKDINGLQEGTKYYYRVRTYNVGGDSTFSNTASETTPPNAPSNLNASTLSSSGIRVTWIDHSNKEDGFEIWQKKESGSWQLKTTVKANVRSKNINGLQEGTKYYYRVRAYKGSVKSNWSNTDFANTEPNAPSDLNANAHSSSAIRVTWTDHSNKESGFEIWQQKGDSGSWELKATVKTNVTSKDITGLQSGTKYCYKVRAYKGSVKSNWSNRDCDTTHSVPAAPSNLRATAPECFEIKLTWQDNSNNEQGFKIYRQSGSNWYRIATVASNVTKFWDTELPCSQTFSYKVRAYNAGGNSSYSNIASAKTISCYYCGGGLSLKIIPDKKIVNPGALVTYTYKVKNKGKKDLKNIKIKDEKFGDISIEFTLEKGKSKTFIKTATLTETTTNFAEATAIYKDKNKIKSVKAHACATVEVKK